MPIYIYICACVCVCVKGRTPTDVAFIIIAWREGWRTTLRVNLRHSIMETQPLQLTSPKYTCVYAHIPSSLSSPPPPPPPLPASVVLGRRASCPPHPRGTDRGVFSRFRVIQAALVCDWIAGAIPTENHVRLNVCFY